jgi:RNA polymerase sigma-70 factor (ECF subfamily)
MRALAVGTAGGDPASFQQCITRASGGQRIFFPTGDHVAPSTSCVTDLELLERARRGDTGAFGQLVERHRVAAHRAARAALGSRDEADDVVQEACIAAFRKLAGFRGEASFRTWLLAITWRRALSRRRSARRWVRQLAERRPNETRTATGVRTGLATNGPAATENSTPEQALLRSELHATIERLVRELPRRLRDPLLLTGSGEFSYEEVASLVGAPVGTVKWRVSDARRRIRARLRRLGYDDVA